MMVAELRPKAWILALVLNVALACLAIAQSDKDDKPNGPPTGGTFQPQDGPGFGGPPPFGPGGGPMMQEKKVVKRFDKDGNGWLNAEERKAAIEALAKEAEERPQGRRGWGPRQSQVTPQPGRKLTPADAQNFPDASLYASDVIRTLFLEFENKDWEKELSEFKNTDVDVPVKLTVDGKMYDGVGVHFHGMSSYMMVAAGLKRSLVLSLDFINDDQRLYGYRTLNLLNAHEDASFMRTVLALQIARGSMPAPNANFVRVVINGECWGLYVNQQHFNKDFTREAFGSAKGARWKVKGSPGGRGGLNYLGDDLDEYKTIYEIKTKDDPEDWASLVRLCKVLDQTPEKELEQKLESLLDVDGALKFFAWENVLSNGDGFWARASDYSLYLDEKDKFHIVPYDANETFSFGGGPGGPGGPGGRRGFGPGMFLASQMVTQSDADGNSQVSKTEFANLAGVWFKKLGGKQNGTISQEQLTEKLVEVMPPPSDFGPPGGAPGGPGPGGGGPAMFIGGGLFGVLDVNKDGSLTESEITETFGAWFAKWDAGKQGSIDENAIRDGLNEALPRPDFAGPGGGRQGGRGRGSGGGGFRGFGGGGVKLDPFVAASDEAKPLISKLLAVPALRTKYLGYVRTFAENSLDWKNLAPMVAKYRELITEEVKLDTKKLESFEEFEKEVSNAGDADSPEARSLKNFAAQRRDFLLNNVEVKKAATAGK